jgi:predicted nucleotidyltransferase
MSIQGLPEGIQEKLQTVFQRHPGIQNVTLYGSRAKGTARSSSDIDLCILAPDWGSPDLSKLVTELDELNLPWKLDVNLEHMIQLPALREHIDRVGKTIYS